MNHQTLRARRVAMNITQQEIANYVGVSQAYISKVESGEARLSPEMTRLAAEILMMNEEDLSESYSNAAIAEIKQSVDMLNPANVERLLDYVRLLRKTQ